ncbi:MAG TPA: ATP synthase subunit C [Anaerolineales bacterium]|nr:ATP synthase subunit C [Anaerolineales bacterium]
MIKIVIVALATLIPLAPVVMYFLSLHTKDPVKAAQKLVAGFKGYNLALLMMGLGIAVVWLFSPQTVLAATAQQGSGDGSVALGLQYLAAAVSTGLAALGAGVAVSGTGAAAIGAIAEKPEALGRSLIFVGLAEGVAIYGLLISFLVLPK